MKFARTSLTFLTVSLIWCAASARAESLGPVQTLQSFQKALAANPPQVQIFWTSLPASYQTEIRNLISTFAEKTDPELWNASFRLLGKTAKVARQQDKFIRGSQFFAQFAGQEGTDPNAPFFTKPKSWNSMVTIVETIAASDIRTHEGLRKLDPGRFLATTGTKVAKACIDLALAASGTDSAGELEQFKSGTFSLVEENDDAATVKFSAGGRENEIRLTKVEGKWVLAEMASEFENAVAQAQKSVSQLPTPAALTAEQKSQCLALAKAVEDGLDELLAAESQVAFDAVGARLAQQLPALVVGAMQNVSGSQHALGFKESAPPTSSTRSDEDSDDKSSDE